MGTHRRNVCVNSKTHNKSLEWFCVYALSNRLKAKRVPKIKKKKEEEDDRAKSPIKK